MQKIRKNDTVQILSGRERGRRGQVLRLFGKNNQVLVPGLNQYKKHRKPNGGRPGEIVTLDKPIAMGKIGLVCPKCKTVTRVGFLLDKDVKSRICRKCKYLIDSPQEIKAKNSKGSKKKI